MIIMATLERRLKLTQEVLARLLVKTLPHQSHRNKITFMSGQEGAKQLTVIVLQKG